MDIIKRSKKAQEIIDNLVSDNFILKTLYANQDKEIERLRARVKLLEKTLIKAAIALEDQGLYEAPLMCRKIVEGGEK